MYVTGFLFFTLRYQGFCVLRSSPGWVLNTGLAQPVPQPPASLASQLTGHCTYEPRTYLLISGTHKAADLELASVSTTDLYARQRKFMVTFTEKRVALLLLRRAWLGCLLVANLRRATSDCVGSHRMASCCVVAAASYHGTTQHFF